MADALAYAHAEGVVHRDIKPANIMILPDGRPKLTDFGLAHLESTVMTTAGQFLGSPSYMSPEQVVGGEVTARSDLYALSVVAYEMLTGDKPFPGENITTVVYKVVHSDPVPPHELNAELPPEYDDVFRKALAKDPTDRFQSFSHFVAGLNLKEFDKLTAPSPPQTVQKKRADAKADAEDQTLDLKASADVEETAAVESKASITERKRGRKGAISGRRSMLTAVAILALGIVGLVAFLATRPTLVTARIETNPADAEVYLNGTLLGSAPLELEPMPPGEHTIRIEKDGFLPLEETFLLEQDAPEALTFALQPARVILFIESVPGGARVRVDGEAVGTTPLEDVEIEPGQHEVEVSRSGYELWRSAVVAQGGESVNLTARLRSIAPAESRPEVEGPSPQPVAPPEGGVVKLGPDDKPAKRISGNPPVYPPMARKLNQQGRVTVAFIVTEEGVPTELRIVESGGEILDSAVLHAVAEWRYEPAEKDGARVRVQMMVRQTFRLGS